MGPTGVSKSLDDCDEALKILMFGRGAAATLYAWALEPAGHAVEFYVRPERLDEYGSSVALKFYDARSHPRGSLVNERFPVRLRTDIPHQHDYDVIVVSVQSHQLDAALATLTGYVNQATVLVLGNLWADPEQAARHLPRDQVVWGFPSIGGGFDPDGVLHGVLFKKMRFGIFRSDPTSRELKIRELFQGSGFSIREQRDYREWLWVNLAIGAALLPSALVAGSIRPIISSISQWKQVRENMQDVQRVLIARGLDLSAHRSHLLPARLPTWIFVPSVKLALRLSPPLRALADANVNESEARGSVNAVIEEAHRLDVRVPHLEDAHRRIQVD